MTYKQTMKQRCKCGRFCIGGWVGDKRKGYPNFSRVSCPAPDIANRPAMTEEHTRAACYAPVKIA